MPKAWWRGHSVLGLLGSLMASPPLALSTIAFAMVPLPHWGRMQLWGDCTPPHFCYFCRNRNQ